MIAARRAKAVVVSPGALPRDHPRLCVDETIQLVRAMRTVRFKLSQGRRPSSSRVLGEAANGIMTHAA
jgi:hypothetical protein